jgi:hypothetical protein
MTQASTFLRRVLMLDAVATAATGLMLTFGASLAKDLLGLPQSLMQYAGVSLLPFAALVGYLATRETISRPAVWAVIAYNALWSVDSIVLLMTGWVAPTALGYAFVIAQALVVALLAELEYVGLRRMTAATA